MSEEAFKVAGEDEVLGAVLARLAVFESRLLRLESAGEDELARSGKLAWHTRRQGALRLGVSMRWFDGLMERGFLPRRMRWTGQEIDRAFELAEGARKTRRVKERPDNLLPMRAGAE